MLEDDEVISLVFSDVCSFHSFSLRSTSKACEVPVRWLVGSLYGWYLLSCKFVNQLRHSQWNQTQCFFFPFLSGLLNYCGIVGKPCVDGFLMLI
jgi:hypothetical protein